jgi:hypothetical protein
LLAPLLLALMLQDGSAALRAGSAAFEHAPARGLALVASRGQPSQAEPDARYLATARAVSTWQAETVRALSPAPLAALAVLSGAERPVVTRCVKLNNPWCIKRAHWPGEIGADEEGHTAFAGLDNGADAAARLLRSYYVAFGRHSALDIVRRWAPAECGSTGASPTGTLAVRGLGMTLRARFLVSHRRGGRLAMRGASGPSRPGGAANRAPGRIRVTIVPLHAMPSYRVPDIAAGMGERRPAATASLMAPSVQPRRAVPRRATAAPAAKPPRPAAAPGWIERIDVAGAGAPACGGDETRIQNYAARIAGSVGLKPADDLKLFDAEGRPSANLPAVMLAMSSVELGYLYAGARLIEAAVARLASAAPPAEISKAATGPMPDGPAP